MNLLELEDVRFRYPDGSVGLNGCSLSITRGSRNALLGVNGSGKTTLFQHTNGLLRPQSGQLRYAGVPIDYSRSGLRELRSRVGIVFQNPDRQLFSASVQEDVSFGPFNLGLGKEIVRERVASALQAVGMEKFADKAVHNLSFGQKKRVCIAGVLAMEPELLVLDEPMAGLDVIAQHEFMAVLDDLHARGITLLLATHDIDFAYAWADRIHLMSAGQCAASIDARSLADGGEILTDVGLPLPAVLELERKLRSCGLFSREVSPRSHRELLSLLDESNTFEKEVS